METPVPLPREMLGAWPRPAAPGAFGRGELVRCRKCRVFLYRRDRLAHLATCSKLELGQLFEDAAPA